jgi:lysophospholipase L1-like esterase
MTAQNRTTLKAYFNTADIPTEAQFANLIDSFLLVSGPVVWAPSFGTGLLASYLFDEGTGLVANDSSGNANNMTLTGVTWSNGGVVFGPGKYGTLPATVRASYNTFYLVLGKPTTSNNYYLSNSDASLNIRAQQIYSDEECRPFGLGVISGNTAPYPVVLAWTCSAANGNVPYINGRAPGFIFIPGPSEAIPRGLATYLGGYGANLGAAGYAGNCWGAFFYSGYHSAAEVARNSEGIRNLVSSRVGLGTFQTSNTAALLFLGDSRMSALTKSAITTTRTYTKYDYAQSSTNTLQTAAIAGDVAPLVRSQAAANRVVVWGGVNDYQLGAYSPSETFGRLRRICKILSAAGWEPYICTEISATGYDTQKNALNALILASGTAGWAGFANGVIRLDSTALGTDGAFAGANFDDGLHPSAAGRIIIQNAIAAAIEAAG